METSPFHNQALGEELAREVMREAAARDVLRHKPHWLFGAWPYVFAGLPGIWVIVGTEIAIPARVCIAVAVAAAFGLAIEHYRLSKKLKAAVELLEIQERRNER